VADRLSVSVPGLYHYVQGRDDLLALAAEQSMRQRAFPADHGQHWAVWLLDWAEYIHGAFASDPGLLKQYIDGAIGMEVMAESIDAALAPCIRQGFTPTAALYAYELVAGYAIGAAVAQIRDGRTRAEGRPFERELRRVMTRGDLPLPHLGGLAAEPGFGRPAPFRAQIATVLIGIAVQRGEPAEPVATLLAGRDGTG
jgi:AcrR family transcriptional regulator